MKSLLLICAVLAIVACSNAFPKREPRIECYQRAQTRMYENKIKELIEKLREQLKNGIPDKNIPVMDPLDMNDARLQLHDKLANLDWNMTGKIEGLTGFNIETIKFSLAGLKFNFELRFPEIKGKGIYGIDGIFAGLLPVYGEGNFDVSAHDLVIKGSGKIGSKGSGDDQTLFLEQFSVQALLEKFIFDVSGLMDDEKLSLLISKMLSESLPNMLDSFKNEIDTIVSSKAKELADGVLSKMTVQDLLNLLKPKTQSEFLPYYIHCGDPIGEDN